MVNISPPVEALVPDMIALRRDLHRHPELGFQEVRTAGIVAERLRALGYTVRTGVGKTGVTGFLKCGAPGSSSARTWTPCRSAKRPTSPGSRSLLA
jgi:metal-dependent amidase/aminoacylase/carboxypeptidase family protein